MQSLQYPYVLLLLATLTSVHGDRLNRGIILYGQDLHLTLTEDSFQPPYEFQGHLWLKLSLDKVYPGDLKMYAAHDFIKVKSASLEVSGEVTNITSFDIDEDTDILTLSGTSIAKTTYYGSYLNIYYTSRLSVEDMYGLYKMSYKTTGGTKDMVASQLVPAFARRVFPCFDELNYKTGLSFNITHPEGMEPFFNTPINFTNVETSSVTTNFIPSGDMEIYMSGFMLVPKDDFTCTSRKEDNNSFVYYYQVCSRSETELSRKLVFENGFKILEELNNYTDYEYGIMMGFFKLDLVALPEMATEYTENFGLITFREDNLLYDEENSSILDKQNIILNVAFELAQMWFGDFVTPQWWNFSYFTKGLSYYIQYFITDKVQNDWELDNQFVFRVFQRALHLDSLENSPNLRTGVNSTQEIMSQLDELSYLKGASIFRMIKEVMTEGDNFKTSIVYFITNFSKRNTEPQGLWNLIGAQININNRNLLPSDKYFRDVLIDWETNAGFPLLEVIRKGSDLIRVEQKGRFLYTGLNQTYQWCVPVSYAFSSNISDFENATLNQWLLPGKNIDISLPSGDESWMLLNVKSAGYYRVNYGDMWLNIASALTQSDFSGIPEINRAQLLDDALALARAGVMKYSVTLDLLKYLTREESLYPWMTVFDGFDYILRRVGSTTSLGLKIEDFLLDLLTKVYSTVAWTNLDVDNHMYSIKQIEILTGACNLGYSDCVRNAVKEFNSFKNSGKRPAQNLRSIVYCTGFLYNSQASGWDVLWEAYTTTEMAAEKVKILQALGCTENKNLLQKSLALTLNETSGISRQDNSIVFTSVYSKSRAGTDAALTFLIENYRVIMNRYQCMNCLKNMVLGLAEYITEDSQITQLRKFLLETKDLPEEIRIITDQALEITGNNAKWLEQHFEELNRYFQ